MLSRSCTFVQSTTKRSMLGWERARVMSDERSPALLCKQPYTTSAMNESDALRRVACETMIANTIRTLVEVQPKMATKQRSGRLRCECNVNWKLSRGGPCQNEENQ